MLGKPKLDRTGLIGAVLLLAVLAVYAPVLWMDFTNYDDPSYVTENRAVRAGLTWHGIAWAFTNAHSGNWHPVTWISHMLDCSLFGLNPAGHHAVNLLLHACNTVLAFLVFRSLTGAFWRSAGVAGLFALHPMHVESVAWISERKDVLSACFGLLCLWAYGRYAGAETRRLEEPSQPPPSAQADLIARPPLRFPLPPQALRFYALALVFFVAGLLSKPMLVTWPFVLLLLDYWPLRRWPGSSNRAALAQIILEKLPFFVIAAISGVITFVAQKGGGAVAPLDQVPLGMRLANVPISYCRYLWKLVWPHDLAVIYPLQQHWPASLVLLALAILTAASVLVWWQRRRGYLVVGWAWFLGTLVPVIGLVQVGNQSIADRYTYLPATGVFVIVAWGFNELMGTTSFRRVLAAISGAAALTACALAAQVQVRYWQNTETLFRRALAVTTNNFVALNSLGFYLADLHEARQAERYFHRSLAINPRCAEAWNKLGSVLIDQGRYPEAIEACGTGLRLAPRMPEAYMTLAVALAKHGNMDAAIAEYTQALALRPDYAAAHYNLANALAGRGHFTEAHRHYEAALQTDPDSADTHNNLAFILAREGHLTQAVEQYQAALALKPELWQAGFGLGDVLARLGRFEEAIREYRQVLNVRPDFPEALNRLAWLLAAGPEPRLRDGPQAVELASKACALTGYKQAQMLATLAVACAEGGRFAEAVNIAEQAQELAQAAGQTEFARRNQQRLELFRAGRAYHDSGGQGPSASTGSPAGR